MQSPSLGGPVAQLARSHQRAIEDLSPSPPAPPESEWGVRVAGDLNHRPSIALLRARIEHREDRRGLIGSQILVTPGKVLDGTASPDRGIGPPPKDRGRSPRQAVARAVEANDASCLERGEGACRVGRVRDVGKAPCLQRDAGQRRQQAHQPLLVTIERLHHQLIELVPRRSGGSGPIRTSLPPVDHQVRGLHDPKRVALQGQRKPAQRDMLAVGEGTRKLSLRQIEACLLVEPAEDDGAARPPHSALARRDREHAARRHAHHTLQLAAREVCVIQDDERPPVRQVSPQLGDGRDHGVVGLAEALEESLQDILSGLARGAEKEDGPELAGVL
jgi:hypothetical protein